MDRDTVQYGVFPWLDPRLSGLVAGLLALWWPGSAFALQIHGPPEGLYGHVMAHLFFVAAIVFFLVLVKRSPAPQRPWRYLKISMVFFLLWNLDTLLAHYLSLEIPDEAFSTVGDILAHRIEPPLTTEKLLFYIFRNDHLFCVPAMFFLVLGLKSFSRCAKASRENGVL